MSLIEFTYLLSEIRQELTDLEKIDQILYQCRTGRLIAEDSETYATKKVNPGEDILVVLEKLFEDLKANKKLGPDNLDPLKSLLSRKYDLTEKINNFQVLREDFNGLMDKIIQKPFNDDYTFKKLLTMYADILEVVTEDSEGNKTAVRETTDDITDVRTLLKKIEQEHLFVGPEFSILEKIVEKTGDQELMNDFKEYQKKWVQKERDQRRKDRLSAPFAYLFRKCKAIGELLLHCSFKIPGKCLVVSVGLILHAYNPAYVERFEGTLNKILPLANKVTAIMPGSVCFAVQAENRMSLMALWEQYQDGTLQRELQKFLVTEDIRQLADGQEVFLSVNIDEQDFKDALLRFIIAEREVLQKDEQEKPMTRARRNSDSVLYVRSKENEASLIHAKLRQIETKFHVQGLKSSGKEFKQLGSKTEKESGLTEKALRMPFKETTADGKEKIENLMKENNSLKAQMVEIRGLADEALSPKDTSERSRGSELLQMSEAANPAPSVPEGRTNDPPEHNVTLLKTENLPSTKVHWRSVQLPFDVVLLTLKECEFVSCLSHLKPVIFKSFYNSLGYVYFGDIGEDKIKLKIAVILCNIGSNFPRSSAVVVKNAVKILRPKAVFCVGFCGGLNHKKLELGDVVVSARIITYASESGITESGIQQRGVYDRSFFAEVVRVASYAWKAPLKDPGKLEVKVHKHGAFLSGPEVVHNNERREELIRQFPDAIAIEMEGEGLYTALDDLNVNWIVIKGVSEFADGKKSKTNAWRTFASTMAASLTTHLLSSRFVFQRLPDLYRRRPTIKEGTVAAEDLEAFSQKLERSWRNVARHLRMSEALTTGFLKDNDSFAEAAYGMLRNWKEREGSDATYQVLYDCLCHATVNRRDLAEDFCVESEFSSRKRKAGTAEESLEIKKFKDHLWRQLKQRKPSSADQGEKWKNLGPQLDNNKVQLTAYDQQNDQLDEKAFNMLLDC